MENALGQERLAALLAEAIGRHGVPGASLALLADGETRTAAAGSLNLGTGVAATVDSVFQIGSITKVYTATAAMRLVEQGRLALDARVADLIPGFRVADPQTTAALTVRHLLTHTSGLAGDVYPDTGRGDDAVALAVDSYATLPQELPLDSRWAYCNSGWVILGRVLETVTGTTWDAALRTLLLEPAGLAETMTLPEEALRFRAALGHVGEPPQPSPQWGMPRALGPAGLACATARDLVAFARLHLDGGVADDGARVLAAETVAQMQREQVSCAGLSGRSDAYGLGWMLFDWGGRRVVGHDGGTIGQLAYLRFVPDAGVALGLLTNGGDGDGCFRELAATLLRESCGVVVPQPAAPAAQPAAPAAEAALLGRWEQAAMRLTVTRGERGPVAVAEALDPLEQAAAGGERAACELAPLDPDRGRWLLRAPGIVTHGEDWAPLALFEHDGVRYAHLAGRAMRRVGDGDASAAATGAAAAAVAAAATAGGATAGGAAEA